MEPVLTPPPERDPEFEPIIPTRLIELDHSPESYQRLVANPFLGFFAILVWLAALYAIVVLGWVGAFAPMAVVLMIAILWLIPGLFQYHCLDCGRTGKLSDWRRHICLHVAERRIEGRVRRIRGPTPPVQIILWLWILMALALSAHSLGFRLPSG